VSPAADSLPDLAELERAATIVHAAMPATPQYRWPLLEDRLQTELWCKHENHSPVGAFKVRGGLVYFERLARERPEVRGVVSATRGNHGQSVGFAAQRHGRESVIVVPHGNALEKNRAMRALGVELIEEGRDFAESNEVADRIAAERSFERMPSFHMDLVAGVGTYAMELFRAAGELDVLYVPIGLGSGACGCIAARDALGLRTEIVGVVSSLAPAYARSWETGTLTAVESTTVLADGMACRVPSAAAWPHLRRGLSRIVEVTDEEVAGAMRALFADTHNAVEGAGAAGLAAAIQERGRYQRKRIGVPLCGGNVDSAVMAKVLAAD